MTIQKNFETRKIISNFIKKICNLCFVAILLTNIIVIFGFAKQRVYIAKNILKTYNICKTGFLIDRLLKIVVVMTFRFTHQHRHNRDGILFNGIAEECGELKMADYSIVLRNTHHWIYESK